jgi:SAM-dependent methyltransferase
MTVGDGRYGSDAAYLKARGMKVRATTLTDEKLRQAHDMGHIDAYAAENAERLSCADNSFDFVLCKEAYHHFPRPPIALYEMLRVARVAVVMIEPVDNPRLLDGAKRLAKRLLRGNVDQQFEPAGNFIYRLNVREVRKLMLSLGGEVLAHRGINDFYHSRLIDHPYRPGSWPTLATGAGIAMQDALCAAGLLGYGLACIVVFKASPPPAVQTTLRGAGFAVDVLPRNPYLT